MEEETILRKKPPILLKGMEKKQFLYLIKNRNKLVEKEKLFKEI